MKKFLFAVLLIAGFSVNSQTTQNQFSLNFLVPSAEYEVSVSEKSTIDFNLGVGFAYTKSDFNGEHFGVFPGFETQYRYYYNLAKRADKGKKTSENSGNYIAGVASLSSGDPIFGDLEYANDYWGFVGPSWGLQRIYRSNFKLNLNLGAGLGFNDSGDTYFSGIIGIQLGFKLGKEK